MPGGGIGRHAASMAVSPSNQVVCTVGTCPGNYITVERKSFYQHAKAEIVQTKTVFRGLQPLTKQVPFVPVKHGNAEAPLHYFSRSRNR